MALNEAQFDLLVQQIQQNSFAEARQAYGEKGFERWRQPRFSGSLPDADSSARVIGSCGDVITIYLKFENNMVKKASYTTTGCGSSALCGSFTAELAHNKTAAELMQLQADDVLQAIGQFPQEDRHCATLAIMALHKALHNYRNV